MRYTVALIHPDGRSSSMGEARRFNGALSIFEATVAETLAWSKGKAPEGARTIIGPDGKGEHSEAIYFLTENGPRLWRTIRIIDTRAQDGDLTALLAESLNLIAERA